MKCSCGCTKFNKRSSCSGIWEETIEFKSGVAVTVTASDNEIAYLKEPITIRCSNCRKRYENPDWNKGLVKTTHYATMKL